MVYEPFSKHYILHHIHTPYTHTKHCLDRDKLSCILHNMNTEQVLTRLHIDHTCRIKAVQEVRSLIETSANPLAAAKVMFTNLTAPDTEFTFTDANDARLTVACLVESAIKLGEHYDPDSALKRAAEWIVAHKVKHPYCFVKSDSTVVTETQLQHGVNVQVKVDGKLKKGSKQILAKAIFDKDPTISNSEMIKLFVKELDMSEAGSRTYVYNLRKAAK